MCRRSRGWREGTSRKKTDRARESAGQYQLKRVLHPSARTSQSSPPSSRYRRDARSLDEDEELWFNDDDDDDEGEAVEKSRLEDDFSDSYGKYMEAKKGQHPEQLWIHGGFHRGEQWMSSISHVLAGAANGASNNVKAAALPPGSTAVTPNSSSASPVKAVSLPATPVMKVTLFTSVPRGLFSPDLPATAQVQNCGGNSE